MPRLSFLRVLLLGYFLALMSAFSVAPAAKALEGEVIFDADELVTDGNAELQSRMVDFWSAYLNQDSDAMSEFFTDYSIRISQRSNGRQIAP
jgi:hypothetical protein